MQACIHGKFCTALLKCADQDAVSDHNGLEFTLPQPIEVQQDSSWHTALFRMRWPGGCRRSHRKGVRQSSTPGLLQGPLWHTTLSACAEQGVAGDHIGLKLELPHLVEALHGAHWLSAHSACAEQGGVIMKVITLGWSTTCSISSKRCTAHSGKLPIPHAPSGAIRRKHWAGTRPGAYPRRTAPFFPAVHFPHALIEAQKVKHRVGVCLATSPCRTATHSPAKYTFSIRNRSAVNEVESELRKPKEQLKRAEHGPSQTKPRTKMATDTPGIDTRNSGIDTLLWAMKTQVCHAGHATTGGNVAWAAPSAM